MNKMKPIWLRNPDVVNESEYTEFYKTPLGPGTHALRRTAGIHEDLFAPLPTSDRRRSFQAAQSWTCLQIQLVRKVVENLLSRRPFLTSHIVFKLAVAAHSRNEGIVLRS